MQSDPCGDGSSVKNTLEDAMWLGEEFSRACI